MSLFQNILVPLDGSSRAEAVLPIAARIARHTGATLILVRVLSLVSESWLATITANPLLAEAVVETSLKEASSYLERVAASPELANISLQTVIQHGPAASGILEEVRSSRSDLIVLSRHGATGITRWMMGSVAAKVVRHASVPVLVVSEREIYLGSPADLIQPLRLLVPLDGSISARAALEPGVSLLTALAAPGQKVALHLAYVMKPQHASHADVLSRDKERIWATQFLSQTTELIQRGSLAPTIAQQGIPVTWSVILDTDVASALLRVVEQGEGTARSGGYQLLAMSTHGRTGFQMWTMGSITERVLSATQRPMLIVHPLEEPASPLSQREIGL